MARKKTEVIESAPEMPQEAPEKPKRIRKPAKVGPALRGDNVVSPIADLFREKIQQSGMNAAEVARRSGIDYSVVFRFIKGERDLNSPSYHQLMQMFNGKIIFEEAKGDD